MVNIQDLFDDAKSLSGNKLGNPSRRDGVVPLSMEAVPRDPYRCQFLVRDFDPRLVSTRVKLRFDLQSGPGRGVADQVDYHRSTHQRTPAPILRQMRKHPVLDRVPLARPRREVAHRDREPQEIGQLLERYLPKPRATTVTAAGIGRDQEPLRGGIDLRAHLLPPAAKRLRSELGRVVIHTDAHPTLVPGFDVALFGPVPSEADIGENGEALS